MIEWAGRGVAMGHAPDALKDAADAVTGTVHEDGLAAELARYV
jgi:hydroxymethylpyrimidine pyrophosphatase-like HAD family hydrolase